MKCLDIQCDRVARVGCLRQPPHRASNVVSAFLRALIEAVRARIYHRWCRLAGENKGATLQKPLNGSFASVERLIH
jgi:hypothetical protein